jgi:hypothetical protein
VVHCRFLLSVTRWVCSLYLDHRLPVSCRTLFHQSSEFGFFWSCFFPHGVYSVHCAPTFEFECPLRIATGHISVIFSFFYNWGDTNCEHHFPCSTSQLGSCIYESIVCVLHADLPIGAFPINTVYKISCKALWSVCKLQADSILFSG